MIIYIYIERERERVRERNFHNDGLKGLGLSDIAKISCEKARVFDTWSAEISVFTRVIF